MKLFFTFRNLLIINFLLVTLIGNTQAQNLSLSKSSGFKGQSLSLTISSSPVTFQQSSPTVCPSSLNVTASDVVFEQASSTSFTPTSITTNNGVITANLDIPTNIQSGNYNVIIGGTSACPVFQNYAFNVYDYSASISPSSGAIGQTLDVTVSGNGIDFHQGSSTICPNHFNVTTSNVVFRQGSSTIYPASVSVSSESFQVSIPLNATKGYYDLVIDDGGVCPYTKYGAFWVSGPSIQLSPSEASVNQSLSVTITGTNVDFTQGSSTICPNHLNITTSDIQFRQSSSTIFYPTSISVNNGQITAHVDVPSNAPYGNYDVYIASGSGCDILQYNAFYIMQPYISISPNTAMANQNLNVTISGAGISFQQGSSTICPNLLNVTTSDITFRQGSTTIIHPTSVSVSNGDINALLSIPSNAPTGSYDVIIGDGEACPFTSYHSFYISQPSINSTPNSASPGQNLSVTISGTGISFTQSSPTICPNQINVTTSDVLFKQGSSTIYPSDISLSGGQIIAQLNVPSYVSTGYYDLVVGDGTGCALTRSNALNINAPSISAPLTFVHPNQPVTLNVTGYGVDFHQGSSTICPGNLNVDVSNVTFYQSSSTTSITPSSINLTGSNTMAVQFSVPTGIAEGYYDLIVGTNDNCSYTTKCIYVIAPSITTSPNIAAINETLDVTISGLNGAVFQQGSSTICPDYFNVTTSNVVFQQGSHTISPSIISVDNSGNIITTINVPSNTPLGSYNVIVGYGEACSITKTNGFYLSTPFITSNPPQGYPGENIDIIIKGHGISFTEGTVSNCPTSIDINSSNVVLKKESYIIYPTTISLNTNGEIESLFEVPSDAQNNGFYYLIVGWQDDCSDSIIFPMGIVESNTLPIQKPEVISSIYPNPSDGSQINVNLEQQGSFKISIIDPYGQVVGRGTSNGPGNINLSEYIGEKLNQGIYFITIDNGTTSTRQKLIVR